jgi:hypothetical protein
MIGKRIRLRAKLSVSHFAMNNAERSARIMHLLTLRDILMEARQ